MVRIYQPTRPPQSRLNCSIIIFALFPPFSLHSTDHFADHSEDHSEDQPKKGKKNLTFVEDDSRKCVVCAGALVFLNERAGPAGCWERKTGQTGPGARSEREKASRARCWERKRPAGAGAFVF